MRIVGCDGSSLLQEALIPLPKEHSGMNLLWLFQAHRTNRVTPIKDCMGREGTERINRVSGRKETQGTVGAQRCFSG